MEASYLIAFLCLIVYGAWLMGFSLETAAGAVLLGIGCLGAYRCLTNP